MTLLADFQLLVLPPTSCYYARLLVLDPLNALATFHQLVQPADYLIGSYGVKGAGGLHARSMCSIRVQEWDHDAILALHFYINSIRAGARSGSKNGRKASFGFVRGLFDPIVTLLGFPSQMHGNCSQWTSRALEMCGAVEREHMFPKATWVDMFEQVGPCGHAWTYGAGRGRVQVTVWAPCGHRAGSHLADPPARSLHAHHPQQL